MQWFRCGMVEIIICPCHDDNENAIQKFMVKKPNLARRPIIVKQMW